MKSKIVTVGVVLLALTLFISVVAPSVQAQKPVNWKLRCRGPATFTATATWIWTSDGQPIPGTGGTATCNDSQTVSGTDVRPRDANDFHVTLSVDDTADGQPAKTITDTKLFDPNKNFSYHRTLNLRDPAVAGIVLRDAK